MQFSHLYELFKQFVRNKNRLLWENAITRKEILPQILLFSCFTFLQFLENRMNPNIWHNT